MEYPISLEKLVESLERLPGVGHKTALRYGLYIINNFSSSEIIDLANSLINVKDKIRHCKECGMLTEDEICSICSKNLHKKTEHKISAWAANNTISF